MDIFEAEINEIVPYDDNPRINGPAVDKVAASIEKFGFLNPIIVDENLVIIAGHTRLLAAKKLGLKMVPCLIAEGLTEQQANKYRIIDNKTGELATWDYAKLIGELSDIQAVDMDAFEFGSFEGAADPDDREIKKSNLDEGIEIDLSEFDDDVFAFECPYCGFKWNE